MYDPILFPLTAEIKKDKKNADEVSGTDATPPPPDQPPVP
jgi:hypothetical protein